MRPAPSGWFRRLLGALSSSRPPVAAPTSVGERLVARPLALALAVAALLGACTLRSGFLFDDWSLLAIIEQRVPAARGGLDLYRFIDGAADVRLLTADGPFPWFCAPDLKIALLRPLSAALLVLDDRLFGHEPLGWHLHSALWYLALVAAAGLVLRRLLRGAPLALALLFYAASDTHVMALAWIANRHSEIAVALTLLGLWAHLRAREDGWRPGALLAPLCCACGLLASETALGGLAYFLAFELLGRGEPLRARLRALLPVSLLALAYLLAYKLGGYGTRHSGSYIDPLGEPLAFLRVAPGRALALVGSLFLGPPAEAHQQLPSLAWLWPVLGALALGLLALLLRPALAALEAETRRRLRWLLAGAALSLVPSLGALPGGRLLIVPSLGAAAVCAVLVHHACRRRAGALRRLRLGALVLMLGIRPALTFVASLGALQGYAQRLPQIARGAELPPQPGRLVLAPVLPDFLTASYVPTVLLVDGVSLPRSWWVLSVAPRDHVLTRTAADRIELATVGGPMLQTTFERLLRSAAVPLRRGDTVPLNGLTVRVLDEQDGAPTRIEARFERSLDAPDLWCLEWRDGALRKMTLPKVGESVRVPYRRGPFGL